MNNAHEMEARIKTINRKLGQLMRRFIWNYDQVRTLEEERHEIEINLPAQRRLDKARADFNVLLWSL